MATERSLERLGVDRFDLLLLHNPDRIGYSSAAVWDGMAALREAGLTAQLGVAPGPANGFTLDLIDCLERFGELIDWAMMILNPLEPWPGELCLDAARAHGVKVITRVVDYGGLFWDDVRPGQELRRRATTAPSAPTGWVEAGREKLERMRPIAERHGLTTIQLACQWNLAHAGGRVRGADADPGGRAPGPGRSRTSGPSWRRCRPSSGWPTRRSRRSARSATTPAAWR